MKRDKKREKLSERVFQALLPYNKNIFGRRILTERFNYLEEARKGIPPEGKLIFTLEDLAERIIIHYKINRVGEGKNPTAGSSVSVHYRGMLIDGTVFDSSYQRNEPIHFVLGEGQVISGWDEGISLLNKGASAKLVIPSDLAYGSRGAGGLIPPNATLIFEVELVDFK